MLSELLLSVEWSWEWEEEGQALGWAQDSTEPEMQNSDLALQIVMMVYFQDRKKVNILFNSLSI